MDYVDDAFILASMSPSSLDINQTILQLHLALRYVEARHQVLVYNRYQNMTLHSRLCCQCMCDCSKCCNALRIVKTRKAINDLPS